MTKYTFPQIFRNLYSQTIIVQPEDYKYHLNDERIIENREEINTLKA